jgi:aldehyde dehydrogenase (NAD+)
MAFVGFGNSGMASIMVNIAWTLFSNPKAIVRKYNWIDVATRYAPFKDKLSKLRRVI